MMHANRWLFTAEQLKNTPSRHPQSSRQAINVQQESFFRCSSADMIWHLARNLNLNIAAQFTAIIFMQRFYMCHAFHDFPRKTMVPVFVWLASKVEECPRPVKMVMEKWSSLVNKPEQKFPQPGSEDYKRLYEEMIIYEDVLVKTLGFNFAVDDPIEYLRSIRDGLNAPAVLYNYAEHLIMQAISFTSISLQYEVKIIVLACFQIAMTSMEMFVVGGPDRWQNCFRGSTTGVTDMLENNKCSLYEAPSKRIAFEQIEEVALTLLNYFENANEQYKKKLNTVPRKRTKANTVAAAAVS